VKELERLVRTIPDFPKPGILFRDVTTLLRDKQGLRLTIEAFVERYATHGIDRVVGIEARGFILGGALAVALGAGFVPLRKRGKLPGEVIGQDYALEYGTDRIELHVGAIEAGERVLLVDDLIATGGTALAALELLSRVRAEVVEAAFVIDLPDLGGAKLVQERGCTPFSLLSYPGH
jgi:adenine phosphoribosyltransferase